MNDLTGVIRRMNMALAGSDPGRIKETTREFIETITFASADEIVDALRAVLWRDQFDMPPWARNLAYRLACLQRADDPQLLREAAADLLCFGPDWDDVAEGLNRRSHNLES